MHDLKWSQAEKKIARRVFEAALAVELSEVLSELKERAAAAAEPDDMWSIEGICSVGGSKSTRSTTTATRSCRSSSGTCLEKGAYRSNN